jgi:hypothetical protein
MSVSGDEITVDISKWTNIIPFTGIFSIGIDTEDTSYANRSKYTLSNAIEIGKLLESTSASNNINTEDNFTTSSVPETNTVNAIGSKDIQAYIEDEKKLLTKIDATLSKKLSGQIILQVENNGEAWYVNPENNKRYFLGRPTDAFNLMRRLGLGVSNKDFNLFTGHTPKRLSGKILLKVEDAGKAYYVNPKDLKMYYLGRPSDAFNVMRTLGLGISNVDIRKIDIN